MANTLVEEELARVAPQRDTALTIGVFDGVHLGHRSLVAGLKQRAAAAGLASGVVTFHHHPRVVLAQQPQVSRLTSLQERIRLLESLGVDYIVPLSFTSELSRLSPEEFISLLSRYLRLRALVIGPDFALGKGRKGNVKALRALGEEMGFSVDVVPPMMLDGKVISSTAVRRALDRGEVTRVSQLLGRRFSIAGLVSPGDSRGKTLGFPTANIIPGEGQALPADGVYAAWASAGGAAHPAVVNIGLRPTFGSDQRLVEVHLLDFEGDLYGQELAVEMVERLRDEMRFAGAEELKGQLAQDVEQARTILRENGG